MSKDRTDDYQLLLKQRHLLEEIEQGIRFANRNLINKKLPNLNSEVILQFAVNVGKLRARYLEAALNLSSKEDGHAPSESEIASIRTHREMYEEARLAFDALREAIQKGYVDVLNP